MYVTKTFPIASYTFLRLVLLLLRFATPSMPSFHPSFQFFFHFSLHLSLLSFPLQIVELQKAGLHVGRVGYRGSVPIFESQIKKQDGSTYQFLFAVLSELYLDVYSLLILAHHDHRQFLLSPFLVPSLHVASSRRVSQLPSPALPSSNLADCRLDACR